MQALTTKLQSHELDKQAQKYNLSAERLMDTAGSKAAEWLLKQFPESGPFIVFCGPGHNGGDGWVTAYYLKKAGKQVEVFDCESSNTLLNQKKKQAQSLDLKAKNFNQWQIKKGQILIDALFGVGLTRSLEDPFKELVLKINKTTNPVIALDVPSGLCADRGIILEDKNLPPRSTIERDKSSKLQSDSNTSSKFFTHKNFVKSYAVQADWTLSFALAKPGFYLNEGPAHSGKIVILPIGFPKKLLDTVCNSIYLVKKKDVCVFLPSYKDTANKTHRGWSLIASGHNGMWGCGLLTCQAAYTVGSGYVTWAAEDYPYEKSLNIPEVLLSRFEDKHLFDKKTAVGAGPGLGFSKQAEDFILKLKELDIPIVLDADALTLLAKNNFPNLNKNFLLTPHSGELSRLMNVSSNEIDKDRLFYSKQGAKQYKTWLLLKGFHPILSDGEKNWIIHTGNSALGKAGTGDVLTGILTGLMAQGLSVFEASLLGNILQGETAENWIKEGKDINSFSASEIIRELPFVMSKIRHSAYKKNEMPY